MKKAKNKVRKGRYPNCLREYRLKKLWTQKDLREASGVSQVCISFTENGLTKPMDLTKIKFSRALKVSVDKLFPKQVILRRK